MQQINFKNSENGWKSPARAQNMKLYMQISPHTQLKLLNPHS